MKKCGNCRHRFHYGWGGPEPCISYEMADTENDEIQAAADCREYEEGIPDCLDDGHRTTSATGGDYSPSSPWDAPGMSVRDFI